MLTNIEAERVRHGLTRSEMAKKLNISTTTLARYVTAKWPIPSDTLISMSELFACSTDYLLGLRADTQS